MDSKLTLIESTGIFLTRIGRKLSGNGLLSMTVEIDQEGLFLIDRGEIIHVHTSSMKENDLDALRKYLDEWSIDL